MSDVDFDYVDYVDYEDDFDTQDPSFPAVSAADNCLFGIPAPTWFGCDGMKVLFLVLYIISLLLAGVWALLVRLLWIRFQSSRLPIIPGVFILVL